MRSLRRSEPQRSLAASEDSGQPARHIAEYKTHIRAHITWRQGGEKLSEQMWTQPTTLIISWFLVSKLVMKTQLNWGLRGLKVPTINVDFLGLVCCMSLYISLSLPLLLSSLYCWVCINPKNDINKSCTLAFFSPVRWRSSIFKSKELLADWYFVDVKNNKWANPQDSLHWEGQWDLIEKTKLMTFEKRKKCY